MSDSKLIFVGGLLLAGAAVFGTHWYDRAKRAQDAIQYMVEDEADFDLELRELTGEQ